MVFREGSRLEKIGEECFGFSGIEEIELPGTVREIGRDAFGYCSDLRVIFAEDDCVDSVRKAIGDHAVVSKQWSKYVEATAVGNKRLKDLRSLRDVVIPEGLERIENYWFVFADIESVEVPASVTEIGEGAFH